MKKWVISSLNKENAKRISSDFGIHILPAMLIDQMGFQDDTEIEEFLSDDYDFSDPFLMTDMEKAVERISFAIDENQLICVYGDYDADGVTSTALLYSYLVSIGANVMYYIPSRETEGYGLNNSAVNILKEKGVELIVTVDNGVSAVEQVAYANSLGIDTVITDHHSVPEVLPDAVAIVDPHRTDDICPFKDFCGAGIAFKLIMALEDEELDIDDLLDRFADIAALGTIGDVVSLTGENRFLVKAGLERINDNEQTRLGIAAMKKSASLDNKRLTAGNVAFTLVPRINAGGRLGLSQKSVNLLLTDNPEEAEKIAQELSDDNINRQSIEQEILASIEDKLANDEYIKYRKIIVVEGEGWHQGVIGIAAARIKDKYGKPTVVITYDGENAKGSARSIEGFAMCDGVAYCSDLLTIFGGHPMAAGMSLPTANIGAFREKINEYADSLENSFYPVLNIACKLNPQALSVDMAESLKLLEPYGSGNPTPIFGLYGLVLDEIVPLKGGKHLKLILSRNSTQVSCLLFGTTLAQLPYVKGDLLNVAVTLDVNMYNGAKQVSLVVKELAFAQQDTEALMISNTMYEELVSNGDVSAKIKTELSVTRDDCAVVYRYLKSVGGFPFSKEALHYRLNRKDIPLGKLMVILKAMCELGLINMEETPTNLNIKIVDNPPRVNILSAPILRSIL